MHPLKVVDPDGLPVLFYRKFWHIVGSNVTRLVLDILNNNIYSGFQNSTFIALIPKCKNPSFPKEFRLIILCNMTMKVVTKSIANRLKRILPEVIDVEKSDFLHGRLITDIAINALECFH